MQETLNVQIERCDVNYLQSKCVEIAREVSEFLAYSVGSYVINFDIDFTLKGTHAGAFYYKRNLIRINESLLSKNPEVILGHTVPHEVCHAAAYHYKKHVKHGLPWKNMMMMLGLAPTVCHNLAAEYAGGNYAIFECDQCHEEIPFSKRRFNTGKTYYHIKDNGLLKLKKQLRFD